MQRLKKPFIWLTLLSLVITLLPASFTPVAKAALSSTTYFSPDILDIRKTVGLKTSGTDNLISRDNVYVVTSPTLTINGTYSKVSGTSLKAQIDQLVWDEAKKEWVVDGLRTVPGTVMQDTTDPDKRFVARDLTLFAGMNKITFTGTVGNSEGSESFYVLYDAIPYVSELRIVGGGPAAINLNEGTKVVVTNPTISLEGIVNNITKVAVSVNDGTPLSTDVYNDQLYSPPLTLAPGLNKLKIVLSSSADSVTILRDVYYFDENNPFTDMYFVDASGTPQKAFGTKPTITTTLPGTVNMIMQVLVPYASSELDFSDADTTITINGNTPPYSGEDIVLLNTDLSDGGQEIIIPGADGITPTYRLVTFRVDGIPLEEDTNGNIKATQTAQITLEYGNYTASYTDAKYGRATFSYLPGQVVITDMYYLPDYDGTATDISDFNMLPLNGAEVSDSSFYIMVKANGTPGTLTADYLPLGAKSLSLGSPVASNVIRGGQPLPNTQIYKVTNFANGQQQVQFRYSASAPYNVNISYASKSYIYIDNLIDGQTYTFNSKVTNTLKISGRYVGFENIDSVQYTVNGISGTNLNQGTGENGDGPTVELDLGDGNAFSLELNIKTTGPLIYGENRLVFTGISLDAAGNEKLVRKDLRIYIIDENVSNINKFQPASIPDPESSRVVFPTADEFGNDTDALSEAIANIFKLSTEFTFVDPGYETSEKEYDLLIRGGGARFVNVYMGTEKIFSKEGITETIAAEVGASNSNSKYTYDFVGNESDFILRIRGLKFDAPGTQVYNLELINNTGARTNQRLEITRVLDALRLLAPVPTVGDKFVVNKNFIRFDIEAEGADSVVIGKGEAIRRPDLGPDRFVYDYVGLKPNKSTKITVEAVRGGATSEKTIEVYYTSEIAIDSQYMAEKVGTKYSAFNKTLELSFPKGTILQSAALDANRITKFYPDNKILFGIADPKDGVVERRNDYGAFINRGSEYNNVVIPDNLVYNFNYNGTTINFTRVSQIMWVNGGVGEFGNRGDSGYLPSTNGLAPYSTEGYFTRFDTLRKLVPSQRGEITIKFDTNVVDDAGTTVTMFRYVDKGGQGVWENIGGEVDTKSNTITAPFDEFGYYTVMKLNKSYSDVTNHPWARNILTALYSKGIMNRLRVDAFGADDQTTRGEFAALLVKGLSLPLNYEGTPTFFDVGSTSGTTTWDYKYIETAARAGIITGRTEGFFSPNVPITRQDAAVMIARAADLKLAINDDKLKTNVTKSFLDGGSIDRYALPAVQAVTKAKIMSGSPVTLEGAKKPSYNFNPTSNMTRAEAGKIAVELFKKSTSLFPKNLS
ncbi:S-layer homology domain-containing protein [Paenibacillus senegalimassiliensis]|uniref:S-layer homology domain-containing protein n=1 Tax=Paenibacillus senegalimassiliensis TaxID=1737426 RepID=UPI00073F20F0|nr:S-layer homology domain-containing protein [Paenibacillus senegalimassiliensis]